MTDRVRDPWGERTRYGRGEEWPARVDEYLVDEPDRWVAEASVLHSDGDAYDLAMNDGAGATCERGLTPLLAAP